MTDIKAAAVELAGVTKRFGRALAVDNVSLAIAPGSFTTLLGPSGCGKTTLLRMIAGLLQTDEGAVSIGGKSMAGVPIHKRNIGIVFQNYALFPHLTVAENIAFGLRYRDMPRLEAADRVRAMLDLVQLPGRDSARPDELSGGQRQRVALARALVIEPDVLLLDEPLSALDANLRDEMRIELRSIQQRLDLTTIFVTHDQGEALAMSDAIAVLRGGRTQQVGAPAALYNRPVSAFASNFLGLSNVVRARVKEVSPGAARAEATGLGTVETLPPEAALKPGDPVDLVVRAERLRIERPADTRGENAFPGRIAAVDYQGQTARYLVEAGDRSLYAHAFIEGEPLAAGEDVVLSFWPEDCLMFAPEEESA